MWALGWPVRPIIQAFESLALIAHQPPVHRSPRHAPVCGHLAHGPTVANYCQDRLVPLLSHAHLPHARERDKSAEVGVTYQPKAFWDLSAELLHWGGWGGRIRTFNLLIQSQLRYRCATPQLNNFALARYLRTYPAPNASAQVRGKV